MTFNHAIVLLLVLVGEGSAQLLSPVLPIIAHTFRVSDEISQLTVSLNMVGITIATIIYGPLSDNWGRKKTMLTGLVIFTISSMLCFFAQDLKLLIFFRFLQGLGEGAAVVISYATISDMYDEIRRAKVMSQLNFVASSSSGIAPIVGGAIASYFGWKVIFLLLTALGVAFLISVRLYFKETLNFHNVRKSPNFKSVFRGYRLVLSRPNFILYALIEALPFVVFWGTLTSLPFIFANLGVETSHYGFYVLIYASVYLVGIILNQLLVGRIKVNSLIMLGVLLGMFDVVPLIWNYIQPLSPLMIILLWIPNSLGLAFIIGNAATKALEMAGDHVGAGSAVIVLFYTILGAAGIYFIGKYYGGKINLLFWVTTLSSIVSLILLRVAQKRERRVLKA